jgi:hypothetical protein
MKHLSLDSHLARAVKTFNRVDRPLFRSRMTFPTIDGETSTAAISYFYEPFLEPFDPQLREDLGVWYTPPEIVRYQSSVFTIFSKPNPVGRAASPIPIL